MKRSCPACSAPLVAGEAFCGECGAAVGRVHAAAGSALTTHASAHATAADSVLFALPHGLLRQPHGTLLLRALEAQPGFVGVIEVPGGNELETVQGALAERLAGNAAARLDAVCLLGSPALLPHAAVENEVGTEAVLTDNFYGRLDVPGREARRAGELLPRVSVSRLPFDDAETLLALLARPTGLHPTWEGGALVSCEVWEGASAAVVEHLGAQEPLRLSPPVNTRTLPQHIGTRPGRLYFNVHGAREEPVWVGQGQDQEHPEVLRAHTIEVADGAVVVSEACYGGACFADEEAISQAFLARGANAFFGSTIIAWGPPTAPPGLADLIPIHVYAALDAGVPAGRALLEAKTHICRDYLERDGGLVPQAHNTLLSFCHFGLPGCRVAGAPKSRRGAPRPPGAPVESAARQSLLGALRGGTATGSAAAGSVLGRVRGTLGERASAQRWGVDAFVRGPLEEIARTLGPLRHLVERVHGQRPSSGSDGILVTYRGRLGERYILVAHDPDARGGARGLIADAHGKVLEEFVTRGRQPMRGGTACLETAT